MQAQFLRAIWRWHFYAGLIVLPMIVILSLSGALYLFKPQIERWEERAYQHLPTDHSVSPSAQVEAALAASPASRFHSYRLPQFNGDAAMVHLAVGEHAMRDVFVSPQGAVLGQLDPEKRLIGIARRIHGQLLLGRRGSWLVEWAASWAIVLILSGLVLWWPRGGSLAGVFWPRFSAGRRLFWRDLHAVTGCYVSLLALVLLLSGLPWADLWGSAFKAVRQQAGWVRGAQDWTVGGRVVEGGGEMHGEHDHAAMLAANGHPHAESPPVALDRLNEMVGNAQSARLVFPAFVIPPGAPAGESGRGKPAKGWVLRSDAQNRPLRVTLRYDDATGVLRSREDFASRHPIDKVIAVGVAWHEGQLLGLANQLIGVATAMMLILITISGAVMWWRRKPVNRLGAPPSLGDEFRLPAAGWVTLLVLLIGLPLFTATLLVILPLERWVLRRIPRLARWLGLATSGT